MPPKKTKKSTTIEEVPVVFFLKIDDTQDISPAQPLTTYSELLEAVETVKTERFSTELLKTVLDKNVCEQYSARTACFWCCHTFEWTQIVLPTSYDAYKNVYTCEGNFCSPECALSYNYSNNKITQSTCWNRHVLLQRMYSFLYNDSCLSFAPPRQLLRLFGGPLDIDQYRDYVSGSNEIVLSDLPPIRVQFPNMNVQGPLRDIKKQVSLSTDTVEKASAQLRLKRSNAVSNVNTLDMCIGKNR